MQYETGSDVAVQPWNMGAARPHTQSSLEAYYALNHAHTPPWRLLVDTGQNHFRYQDYYCVTVSKQSHAHAFCLPPGTAKEPKLVAPHYRELGKLQQGGPAIPMNKAMRA